MEGVINFGPNVAILLLTSGSRRLYVIGAYMPPHEAPSFHCVDQALELAPKEMELILLGDLRISLR